jgi:hypothetical protein
MAGGEKRVHALAMKAKNPLTVNVSVADIIGQSNSFKVAALTKAKQEGNDAVNY